MQRKKSFYLGPKIPDLRIFELEFQKPVAITKLITLELF